MTDETLERNRTRTSMWPTMTYRDAPAAIRFLTEAFGFETTALHTGKTDDEVVHAELRRPDGAGIMLGSTRQDSAICGLPPRTGSVYVVTDEPDAVFARATAAGAVVVQGLEDTDYGSRGFTVRDPEGVFWSFGTYAGA
ncbi:VOC family protein [Streptomyces sp. NPDC048639]|uniref:VOC family protein n=1 Tax=Streptomyces sp. NPDC048639 TaxID=3365581 RepID=UPI00371D1C26